MQKFEFLRQPLLGELAMSWKKEEEKKMPFIVAAYVSACSQGQRTHSARTNLSTHTHPIPTALVTHQHSTQDGRVIGKPKLKSSSTLPPIYPQKENPVPHPPLELTRHHHIWGLDDAENHHNIPDGGVVGKPPRHACSPVPNLPHELTGDHHLGGHDDDEPHHNIPDGEVVGKPPKHACSPVPHPPHEQTGNHHLGGHDDDTHLNNIPDDRVVGKPTKHACSSAIIIVCCFFK